MACKSIPTILILFTTLIPLSNGSNKQYKICSSTASCGHIKDIGYPFWIDNSVPGYCGLPDFRLECYNPSDNPYMWIKSFGENCRLQSISRSNCTIVVKREKSNTCLALQTSAQTAVIFSGDNPFSLGATVTNLTLYLGCRNSIVKRVDKRSVILCSNSNVGTSAYYLGEEAEVGNNPSKCQSNVTVPVSGKALEEFNRNTTGWTLERVLEAAFEVHYSIPTFEKCSACENSSGVCASSAELLSNDFVCYHNKDEKIYLGHKLGAGIAGGALLILSALIVLFCFRKKIVGHSKSIFRTLSRDTTKSDIERGSLYFGVPLFSYRDLAEATNNFDESRELGVGGFGRVYHGKLKDGREVAVKQLYEKSNRRMEQFMNEVKILTCLRHQNLVSLYGCTSPHCRELLLVYEYIRNGTVADHLYGENANSRYLSWDSRMSIAIETADALSYLHASDIIHRDVKTNNILLDGNFSVKVADFGLSRLFPNDVTHVSTAPQGTPGYLDPEYHQCYQLTAKSDVYSFGVVLIELISSLPPIDMNREKQEINLSNYAMNKIQCCAFEELVDSRLGFGSDSRVRRMTTSVAELAFQCLQHDKELRPGMDEVSEFLKRIQIADYSDELEAVDEDVRIDDSKTVPPSPIEEDDGVRLLKSNVHSTHQRLHPPSPNSVMDRWGSRSTTASSSTKEQMR